MFFSITYMKLPQLKCPPLNLAQKYCIIAAFVIPSVMIPVSMEIINDQPPCTSCAYIAS